MRLGHVRSTVRLGFEVWGRTHEDVKMSALPLGRRDRRCQN